MKKFLTIMLVGIMLVISVFSFIGCTQKQTPIEEEPIYLGMYKFGYIQYNVDKYDYSLDKLENHNYVYSENNVDSKEPFNRNVGAQGIEIYNGIRKYFGEYVKVYNTKMVFLNEDKEEILTYDYYQNMNMEKWYSKVSVYVFDQKAYENNKYNYYVKTIEKSNFDGAHVMLKLKALNFEPTEDAPIKRYELKLRFELYNEK